MDPPLFNLSEAEVKLRIEQLGDTTFSVRSVAHEKLLAHGRPHSDLIKAASKKSGEAIRPVGPNS